MSNTTHNRLRHFLSGPELGLEVITPLAKIFTPHPHFTLCRVRGSSRTFSPSTPSYPSAYLLEPSQGSYGGHGPQVRLALQGPCPSALVGKDICSRAPGIVRPSRLLGGFARSNGLAQQPLLCHQWDLYLFHLYVLHQTSLWGLVGEG